MLHHAPFLDKSDVDSDPIVVVSLNVAAAVVGNDLGFRLAGALCTKKILSLEGSPLRGELIAM